MKNCFEGYLTKACSSCSYWSDGTNDRGIGCAIPGPIMDCPAFAKMFAEEENKRLGKNWKNILEENEWSIHDEGDIYEIEWNSPAGEDFHMVLDKESPISDFVFQAESFDVDEHIEMWLPSKGKNGTPGSIRELLEDAEAIQQELLKLAELINAL